MKDARATFAERHQDGARAVDDFEVRKDTFRHGLISHPAFASKGEHDPAITDYTKAIELNPQDAIAYYDRGNVFVAEGD